MTEWTVWARGGNVYPPTDEPYPVYDVPGFTEAEAHEQAARLRLRGDREYWAGEMGEAR